MARARAIAAATSAPQQQPLNSRLPDEIAELGTLYPPDQWLQEGRCDRGGAPHWQQTATNAVFQGLHARARVAPICAPL